jgi:hypothetical protein
MRWRKKCAEECKRLEKRELNGLSKVWFIVLDFRRLGYRVCVCVCRRSVLSRNFQPL